MTEKMATKLIHEGEYIAEVDVTLITNDDEWAPYLSVEDAMKWDEVRAFLRQGKVASAARFGRVYRLISVAV